jgi:hypothetical protein
MLVKKIPYDDDVRKAIWPSFKVSIADKHGNSGAIGQRGEENAIKLIQKHFPDSYRVCYDHSEDVIGQYQGIDLTLFHSNGILTVDVKSGKTGLYWDRDKQYWYITIRDDFFNNKRKINNTFMHVGPKGDLFIMYDKVKMFNHINQPDSNLIQDTYGYRLRMSDWPFFVEHNLTRKI